MNKTELNSRIWFRGLKVIFVIAFIFSLATTLAIAYSFSRGQKTFVVCDSKKVFESPYYFLTDSEKIDIYKECDVVGYYLNKSPISGILPQDKRQELATKIQQMQTNGAYESDIQPVVDDYKSQFAEKSASPTTLTSEEFQKMIDGREEIRYINGHYWVANYVLQDRDAYNVWEKIGFFATFIASVCVLFWLLRRIFFYVFVKDKFFKL